MFRLVAGRNGAGVHALPAASGSATKEPRGMDIMLKAIEARLEAGLEAALETGMAIPDAAVDLDVDANTDAPANIAEASATLC
jgi:hypothetical protein